MGTHRGRHRETQGEDIYKPTRGLRRAHPSPHPHMGTKTLACDRVDFCCLDQQRLYVFWLPETTTTPRTLSAPQSISNLPSLGYEMVLMIPGII